MRRLAFAELRMTRPTRTQTGACPSPAAQEIDRQALLGPVRWPARIDARPLVLAAYYPWDDPVATNFSRPGDAPVAPWDTSDRDHVVAMVDQAA